MINKSNKFIILYFLSGSKITTDVEIHLRGVLIPFGFIAKHNIVHALDTALSEFVSFAKNQCSLLLFVFYRISPQQFTIDPIHVEHRHDP
jgi:hypothetical protein